MSETSTDLEAAVETFQTEVDAACRDLGFQYEDYRTKAFVARIAKASMRVALDDSFSDMYDQPDIAFAYLKLTDAIGL